MNSETLARAILDGFHQHYQRFQAVTASAGRYFAKGDWQAMHEASRERIHFYDQRVQATTVQLAQLTQQTFDPEVWQETRQYYQRLLCFHPQAELAETFYNSVFCHLYHRRYFNNAYIFVNSTLEAGLPQAMETEYRSYFPIIEGMAGTMQRILEQTDLGCDFANLGLDIELLVAAFAAELDASVLISEAFRIDVLRHPFYRNKAAYIVGRLVTETQMLPFILPILRTSEGTVYVDALITDRQQMAIIFGFARTYFFVETRAPSALVEFLKQLLPNKTKAELYSAIGFHKQSKTEFYREFLALLEQPNQAEELVSAAGVKGMVMEVFTLPSFPYVFKVIKDRFGGNKAMSRQTVIDRYRMVKQHDRAGRMADTYEFTDVAIPRARFATELLAELNQTIAGSLEFQDDKVIIKHLFVERRMVPLNLFLEQADASEAELALADYGQAIKDMIAANIFPGDMLIKNFGLTRHRRVVFYDYDEVRYLTDMAFYPLPDESEVNFGAGPDDVFPAQLPTFSIPNPDHRKLFLKHHPELVDPHYWRSQQAQINNGVTPDVFPYPQTIRFNRTD
ncbi:bifunctional isocitrate dehydrogenase kinase/phosphatase [Pseudidiomarina taiwanensis]|uniref:Isocitrate dehydrogenase kinase/phosphatase n=1 Tax=Pseudidiomarina taiwanensis TaxID=337250 RepID=A0A432ZEC5_9GAMM|nr:bifunctional isocitrate dehydrogenase kinase/phosphatase [Pseudidiomarina taiwanensis]RUO75712.1 bifunctional isocitrate dehydrogenase kinase/phosphatase [Pseudidiomarina taiwanensis]